MSHTHIHRWGLQEPNRPITFETMIALLLNLHVYFVRTSRIPKFKLLKNMGLRDALG